MVGVLPVLYNVSVVSGEKVAMFEAVIVDEVGSDHAIEKELLEYAIASCTKRGCQKLRLWAKEASDYERFKELGFEQSERKLFTCKVLRDEF